MANISIIASSSLNSMTMVEGGEGGSFYASHGGRVIQLAKWVVQ